MTIAEDAVDAGNVETDASVAYQPLPTATVTFNPTSLANDETSTATIAWSESVTGFVIGDLSVNVGTLANFSGSGDTYTVEITSPAMGSGSIELTIAEDAVSVGNAEASASIAYSPLPIATLTFDRDSVIVGQSVVATLEFSESVTGLAVGDLSVNVGSLSNFSGSGATYTVDITAPNTGSGTLTLTLGADAVTEGNAATSASIEYAPFTVAWEVPTGTVNNRFSARINFSHSVTGFGLEDLRLRRVSGSDSQSQFTQLTNANLTITPIADTNNYTLAFDLTGDFDGVYQLRLRRNTITSGSETYPSSASNSANFTIDSDFGQPTATLTFSETSVRGGRTVEATILVECDGNGIYRSVICP